jgi:hypothetical protein
MALIVAVERGWISRSEGVFRLGLMLDFLLQADRYHGIFPHFLNGVSGRTIPFTRKDDGADLVETSFLMQGLLTARQYFSTDGDEAKLGRRIDALWHEAEWNWHTRGGREVLYWHWSPNHEWALDHEIRGWDECLITYVLAASAPRHRITPAPYHRGWAGGRSFRNGRKYYGIELPLGPPFGGPLAFAHYSFLGLDPRGLRDRYADYWQQNVAHTSIHFEHAVRNPYGWRGYGPQCWGLTASDIPHGYAAQAPDHDLGVIAPTAAVASFPFAPRAAMRALRHYFYALGDRIWRDYGFTDAFSESAGWYAESFLAIDQGPIICMIENHRTGLLWKLFMSCPEIAAGLSQLGFERGPFDEAMARPPPTVAP